MIPLNCFLDSYNKIKAVQNNGIPSSGDISTVTEFLSLKFHEISQMIKQFNEEGITSLVNFSILKEYNEKDIIFEKNEKCSVYYFLLYGDINFYEEKELNDKNKLIKTVSAGTIYGHKIKENYRFYTRARGKLDLLIIDKIKFNEFIENINKKRATSKLNFIKKFFTHMRLFSNDVLENIMQFFIREKYTQYSKVFIDGEYDEFIYLIIRGEIGVCKKPNKIDLPSVGIDDNLVNYIVLEKYRRGEIFGGYSALKNKKCNFTALALSEVTEVYKISKSHLLFYFGGNNGFIPKAIKALDSTQQNSLDVKIEYIKKEFCSMHEIKTVSEKTLNNYSINFPKTILTNKIQINESVITNILKDAWKQVENLDTKLSEFKASLLGGGAKKKPIDIFSKMKETNDSKDYNKISGDATNRIVGRKFKFGLNESQIKSFGKLGAICGAKKEQDEEGLKKLAEISSKMEGKKNNKLTDFDENMKNLLPNNENGKQKENNFLNNKTNLTSTINNPGNNDIDKIPENPKPKKRNKISLKNLLE